MGEVWLSSSEAAALLNKSASTLKRHVKKYTTKTVIGRGGKNYLFLLESLPLDAQKKYQNTNYQYSDNQLSEKTLSDSEIDAQLYLNAPEWARKKADKYLNIINESEGLKGQNLKSFIIKWNLKNPELKTSYVRVLNAKKAYAEQGISGLLAQYGKTSGKTSISPVLFEYFKNLYLKEGGPSVQSCWYYTLGYAQSQDKNIDVTNFPSASTFKRKLERDVPEQAIYLARNGQAAWNKHYARYLDRDYSNIKAGEIWVSDHAQIDVAVMLPDGKCCFPWVTAWRDFKTGYWVGWFVHAESPNSDHIFQSFYYAAMTHGLPEGVYLDNGKDYRCRDFAGGRKSVKVSVDEVKTRSMLRLLNIEPHFALPYNAQTKPIERDFLKNKTYFSKHMIGYRGGNVVERPEILKDEIAKGKILGLDEFIKLFDDYIENVLSLLPSRGKNLKGKSPAQAWAEDFTVKKVVNKDALALFCMRTSTIVSIGRNGVKDSQLGVTYWAEWMSGVKGEKVYIRRDIKAFQEAWIFSAETDEFLGKAQMSELVPALAKTDIEKQILKDAMAQKQRDRKITQAYIKAKDNYSAHDKINHFKAGVSALTGGTIAANPQVMKIANTEMDKVINKQKRLEKTGTYDYSMLVPEVSKPKPKIFLFESDKG